MIRRELGVFLIVGSLTVLVDFLTYRGLLWAGLFGVDLAKATGFLCGTVFAYFANKAWTFAHTQTGSGSVFRFVLLYGLTLGANVLVNSAVLALCAGVAFAIQIAFLLATGTSAVLNFLGMKFFVFRASSSTEPT